MKILVIGGGGREHALAWKIAQSSHVDRIFVAPGNGGTARIAENVPIKADDVEALLEFARKEAVDLTVVGPELPLSLGIVDRFEEEGLKIFGPRKDAALLEASKAFSKAFMERHSIPTARYREFADPDEAKAYIEEAEGGVVVKADGLAAGKGAIVCPTKKEALDAVSLILEER
ncbi:MAG TPA: phosphoribosylamine--glycine ligase, partial [Deltaproteobacteria bacterium]|nr:phosphoribosylamine--glycine ligase [Deltaproteobacteria bacterium]